VLQRFSNRKLVIELPHARKQVVSFPSFTFTTKVTVAKRETPQLGREDSFFDFKFFNWGI